MDTRRTFFAVLLSALLSLQALAAVAVPCGAGEPEMIGTEHMADMDGHAHHMSAENSRDSTNCCDAGYCSQGGCLSLVPFAGSEYEAIATALPRIQPAVIRISPLHRPNLLFRPPTA